MVKKNGYLRESFAYIVTLLQLYKTAFQESVVIIFLCLYFFTLNSDLLVVPEKF